VSPQIEHGCPAIGDATPKIEQEADSTPAIGSRGGGQRGYLGNCVEAGHGELGGELGGESARGNAT
jgi:hypothetical protein